MDDVFSTYAGRLRAAQAAGLACDESAFLNESLTIVPRPATAPWPYVALAMTFGTGTVLSINPDYQELAAAIGLEHHWEMSHPPAMEQIAAEARRRGASVSVSAPGLGFTLARVPARPAVPAVFDLRFVDQAWMNAQQASGRFENGVGEPGVAGRSTRNQWAAVLFERDEPVAVAGAFTTYGAHEIGVDVVRSHRSRGLGALVVTAAAREIVERGETPVYFCDATNVRSQRTALACGFLPVCSDASVS